MVFISRVWQYCYYYDNPNYIGEIIKKEEEGGLKKSRKPEKYSIHLKGMAVIITANTTTIGKIHK